MFEDEAVEVELDFAVANLEDPNDLGYLLVRGLQLKGFCAVDMGFSEELPKEALSDIESMEREGRFARPPDQVLPGLLGEEGSSRIAELDWFDAAEDQRREGRALQYLDSVLSEVQTDLEPLLPTSLGFSAPYRTAGMLHEACMFPDGVPPSLSLEECQQWHAVFARNRLLLVVYLGPHEGRIALKPHQGTADLAVVRLQPGSMVALRPELLSHELVALGEKNYSLTCFLQVEPSGRAPGSPCATKLLQWAEDEMMELKAREMDESVIEEHRTSMPRQWRRLMNRRYFRGQHATVCGTAIRTASLWKADLMHSLAAGGADLAIQVPVSRFDIESVYDPDPEGYMHEKTYCRHGSFADGLELFDNKLFLISPSEAGSMDPHQRMILDCGYEAAFSAGLDKRKLMSAHGGVYVGMSYMLAWNEVPKRDAGAFNQMSGASRVIPANRVSYVLGVKGPSTTTDSGEASALCAVSLGREGVSRADTERKHCDFSICLAANLEFMAGRYWGSYQQLGMLSPAAGGGRCFTFDSLANGLVPGDCVGSVVLRCFAEQVEGELIPCQKEDPRGLVASTAVLHCGRNSSLTAPSGPTQQEAVAETLRWARLSPDDVDVAECHGASLVLHDAVEVGALAKALGADDDPAGVLAVSCLKSGLASSKAAGGIAGLLKLLACGSLSMIAPSVHLNQLNPELRNLDLSVAYMSEALVFEDLVSFSGLSSNGLGGVHAHALLWTQAASEAAAPDTSTPAYERVAFWPAGGGELPDQQQPKEGEAYFIAGSWNGWTEAHEMEDEGDGVFAFTVTLGENRWELFQLWLDGDPERALHPGEHQASKGVSVNGPEEGQSEFAWMIDGREKVVQGDDEELYEMWNEDLGEHGDCYRVRLRIAGEWRTVDWEKLKAPQGKVSNRQFGEYYLIGDCNDWEAQLAQQLQPDPDVPGVFRTEVTIEQAWGEVAFQILRNRDWGQVLCPAEEWAGGDGGGDVFGPEDSSLTQGCNWYLTGSFGDTYCIELHMSNSSGENQKTVTWRRV